MTGFSRRAALVSGIAGFIAARLPAWAQPRNSEWRNYAGDLANTRYAALDQIDASNFSTLEVAWRFRTESLGARPEYVYEGTPLKLVEVLSPTVRTALTESPFVTVPLPARERIVFE